MPDELDRLHARRAARRRRALRRRRWTLLASVVLLGAVLVAVWTGGGDSDDEGASSGAGEAAGGSEESAAAPGPGAEPDPAEGLAAELSPAQLVGQRLVVGFEGTRPPRGLEQMIRDGELAGVILFEDNVSGRSTTRRTIARLQRLPRPEGLEMPLAVTIDQEGGLVKRIDGPPTVSASEMGARGSGFARRQGRATARDLLRHGVNIDLAPVLDVARPGSAIEGELRSFGRSETRVTEVAIEGFSSGLRAGGVAATAKHFPGIGAAAINTDDASQSIDLAKGELRRVDQRPFEAFVAGGGELVMLGLATYPAFSDRPAAFSHRIATGELRRRLGFEGVSITDSLDAAAAQSFGGRTEVATEAARAGADLLLYGGWRTARASAAMLRRKLLAGKLDRAEFERSVDRVLTLRRGLGG